MEFFHFLFSSGYSLTRSTRYNYCSRQILFKNAIFKQKQKMPPRGRLQNLYRISPIVLLSTATQQKSCYKLIPHSYPRLAPIDPKIATFHLPDLKYDLFKFEMILSWLGPVLNRGTLRLFSLKEIDLKFRNFRMVPSRLYRLIFQFFLRGRVEHTLKLHQNLKISTKSMQLFSKISTQNPKNVL